MKKIISLIIIFLLLSSAGYCAKKTKIIKKTKKHVSITKPAKPIATNAGKINTWISNGTTNIIAENIERSLGYDFYEPPDSDLEFIIVSLKQQNVSETLEDIGIDTGQSYIEDKNGKTYPPYLWNEEKMKDVEPGQIFSTEIVFVVPVESRLKVLVLKTIDEDQNSIRINF